MAEKLELTLHILTNAEVAASKMRQFNKTLDQNNRKIKEANSLYTKFRRIFGSIFMTYLGLNGIKSIVNTVRELDLMQRSITGLTKSTQDWAYIQNEAFRTANRIKDVAKGYRNFYAAASMAGFDKDTIQSLYSDVLTSTRAIGATQTQTSAALLALEQMISKGVVSMEELRRQLGNALPGAFEIGAKAMNMTTQEFNEFVKKGQLASNVFVPRFIAQLKKEFAGGFKSAMDSMDASIVNLENSWVQLQQEFMKGSLGKEFKTLFNDLSKMLRSDDFKSLIRSLGYLLSLVVKFINYVLRNKEIFTMTLFVLGFSRLNKALWDSIKAGIVANRVFLGLMTTFFRILAPLLLLQDLIYGLFYRDRTKSLTGDIINSLSTSNKLKKDREGLGNMNYEGTAITKEFLADKNKKEMLKRAIQYGQRTGNWEDYQQIVKFGTIPAYISAPDNSPNLSMNKTETQNININVGDINVQGASSPEETAVAVENKLISLFTSSNLARGVV